MKYRCAGALSTNNMKLFVAVTALTVLAACASISEVSPAGDGRYTLTTQVRGGMTPWGEIKASSLKRADEYCTQQGKQMHQVDMQTHGARGWTPQEAELTFACVAG
jgi:hypothetical protein